MRHLAAALCLLFVFALGARQARAEALVIIDTLGQATTSTQFSVFGSGGLSILPSQHAGPVFTLNQTVTLTEFGAFVNNCPSIIAGVPPCPVTSPFVVQIRNLADFSTVIATFPLSHDNNPLVISYESAQLNLTLSSGTYVALIAPQRGGEGGSFVELASDPFHYVPGTLTMAALLLDENPDRLVIESRRAAVRIVGVPVPEPATLLLLGTGLAGVGAAVRRPRKG